MTSAAKEMSLWCHIEGEDNVFRVAILSTKIVDDLRDEIKKKRSDVLHGIEPSLLALTKVRYIMVSMFLM
jgi:hypothetical protein